MTGDTTLTVTDATLVSIEVTPADASIADGTTQQFTATGLYTDDSTQDLTTEVTWDSSDDEVATVSNADDSKGLATAAGLGTTTVSATSGGVTGVTTLTVTDATLVSIAVTPADPSIADGTTQQFTATGLYTDDSTQDLTTQVTWSSFDEAVATVSNADDSKGLATAAGAGTTTVSATSGGVTGDTTLTVTATLVSIEVSPAAPSIVNGLTQQFTATGLYSDGSTQDLTTEVDLGLVRRRGGDGEQRRRHEGLGDHGQRRQHHRVRDQRRVRRRRDVDRDPSAPHGGSNGRGSAHCGDGRRAGEQSQKQGDGSAGRPRGAQHCRRRAASWMTSRTNWLP